MTPEQFLIVKKDLEFQINQLKQAVSQSLTKLAEAIAREQNILDTRISKLENKTELRQPETEGREL